MIQEQMEFPFMRDILRDKNLAADEVVQMDEEEELESQAVGEFLNLMNKYSISEEDIERISIVAKFF